MNVRLLSPAFREMEQAIRYYDAELPGLGYRFLQELNAAIERIRLFPFAWKQVGELTRRCLLKGFPYAVFYSVREDEITIAAIVHLHRDPQSYGNPIE
jgi:plasmid stabilization system protein ParE